MSIGLKGNVDGSGAIQIGGSDAITISTGLNATFAGTVTTSTGTIYPLSSGTAVASTSGTAIDFTSIPSTAKRITVMFSGVSTSGTSFYQIQIGSGSVVTTGYVSGLIGLQSAGPGGTNASSGFVFNSTTAATDSVSGSVILTTLGSNVWVQTGIVLGTSAPRMTYSAGNLTLSGTLDRVRITTVNGTDTFDAGAVNILWE